MHGLKTIRLMNAETSPKGLDCQDCILKKKGMLSGRCRGCFDQKRFTKYTRWQKLGMLFSWTLIKIFHG